MRRLFNRRRAWSAALVMAGATVVAILTGAWEVGAVAGISLLLTIVANQYATGKRVASLAGDVQALVADERRRGEDHQRELAQLTELVKQQSESHKRALRAQDDLTQAEERRRSARAIAFEQRLDELEERHRATGRKQLALTRELYSAERSGETAVDRISGSLGALEKNLRELVHKESRAQSVAVRRVEARLEHAERKVLGVLETERIQSLENWGRVNRALNDINERSAVGESSQAEEQGEVHSDVVLREIERHIASLEESLRRQLLQQARETVEHTEALLQLMPKVNPKAPLPASGGFAMDAPALLHLSSLIREYKPKRILELGGGTSTIWMAYLTEQLGTEIVSIDHLEEYGAITAASVRQHGFSSRVECRVAPLAPVSLDGEEWRWYWQEVFRDIESVDLLLVDGPPMSTGDRARYPALPLLAERLSPGAVVVLDDMHRDAERRILTAWKHDFVGTFEVRDENVSRLGVLSSRNPLAAAESDARRSL